jgi:membrane protein implicated in regulation of membrane protease activity
MKQMADRWTDAAPGAKQSYLAAFDASSRTTEDLFFGAFLALGLYLAALAAAILIGGLYARWIGGAAGVSAVLVVAGDLLDIAFDAAFVAVLAGFALFLAVLIALGLAMWRRAAAANGPSPSQTTPASELNRRRAHVRQASRATQVE